MRATVIIPIWRGASVIAGCLDAVYRHSGPALHEVICVDNASPDGAGDLIAAQYPAAHLLRQPVNLGFAGGVNVGIANATGDLLVLLNQDCVPGVGWLEALCAGLERHPGAGIAGGVLYDAKGNLNHAGAYVRRSDVAGVHLSVVANSEPYPADYVTGALFAVRRTAQARIGYFDEGFYPGYYEESDYCYRARALGIETILVPGATATHLLSGTEWQRDPLRHSADQHRSRYRFLCKHLPTRELGDFFQAENDSLAEEAFFDQCAGRALGARGTLRGLSEIVARMSLEQGRAIEHDRVVQLRVGFMALARAALDRALRLSERTNPKAPEIPRPDFSQLRLLEVPPTANLQEQASVLGRAESPESEGHDLLITLEVLQSQLSDLRAAVSRGTDLTEAAVARHSNALSWLRDGRSASSPQGPWWRQLIRRWLVRPWHAISGREGKALAAALMDYQTAAATRSAQQSTLVRQLFAHSEALSRMTERLSAEVRSLRDDQARLAADSLAQNASAVAADGWLADAILTEGAVLRDALADLSKGAQLSTDHLRALELMALYDYH